MVVDLVVDSVVVELVVDVDLVVAFVVGAGASTVETRQTVFVVICLKLIKFIFSNKN